MTLKKIEPRFIAGPPGTGKTHVYITGLYEELLVKYSYKKILILSHTNFLSYIEPIIHCARCCSVYLIN